MKKISWSIIIFLCGLIYVSYLWFRPVEIIDVHHSGIWTTRVVVKSFPLTHRKKIQWWKEHKNWLKDKYDIPRVDKNGFFNVTFWEIGSGYKTDTGTDQDSDLLCFKDMKTNANCIEKKKVFEVSLGRNGGLQYR
ncbi:DUF943 family protein [Vibrio quintilis]|uniref:Uncharacterized protein n=1 Tax=Vibrio quintilis TaxID=1117707 RepID=A0A1M7Z039_9VIBR|nr:DUF943 family protein [Vibrio quintilis]SHO58240.1 hypothetical protein VQ7734_04010 [Vibrio quintilis]